MSCKYELQRLQIYWKSQFLKTLLSFTILLFISGIKYTVIFPPFYLIHHDYHALTNTLV